MATKRRKIKRSRQGSERLEPVRLLQYEITDEPIMDEAYNRLPEDVKDKMQHLHDMIKRQPHKAIPELLALREQYPNIHQLSNYLTAAYSNTGQKDKIEQMIQENYERAPDYLFARIHYAELCLKRGDTAKVAAIFDQKFDLKLLYPRRKRFHVSEALGFFGLIGLYYFMIGEREAAERVYTALSDLDPHSTFTRRLKRQLYPGLLRRWLLRWLDASDSKERQV